jgi:hypothetical protein
LLYQTVIVYLFIQDNILIVGGADNGTNVIDTVEVYSLQTGGQILPFRLAHGDYHFAVAVFGLL